MERKIDELGRIVIPKEMRNQIGVNNGEYVNIEINENKIIITKPVNNNKIELIKAALYMLESEKINTSKFIDDIKNIIEYKEG